MITTANVDTAALYSLTAGIGLNQGNRSVSSPMGDLSNLVQSATQAQNTQIQISLLGKEMNELYEQVQSSGNAEALQGLRDYLIAMATDFDRGAIETVVQMGRAAFEADQGDFFLDLMGNFQALFSEDTTAGLGVALVGEASASFSELGLAAAQQFSTTADAILRAEAGESNTGSIVSNTEVLSEFITLSREVRGSDLEIDERRARLDELNTGVRGQSTTVDIGDFLQGFREEQS